MLGQSPPRFKVFWVVSTYAYFIPPLVFFDMFYFSFNWGPPFYTRKGHADPTKRCLYCVFFGKETHGVSLCFLLPIDWFILLFCQIWFFICSFFRAYNDIYLPPIYLSIFLPCLFAMLLSYLCFLSIYRHVGLLIVLFMFTNVVVTMCFYLSVLLSCHPCVFVTIYFLYY